ncbi:hypothetical protein Q3G72_008274 [Acer saccharum]|nr:hypothetical protein Q3G72_008274 [Acer saccharum]
MSFNFQAKFLMREGNIAEFADPKLNWEYSFEAFDFVLKLALSCTCRTKAAKAINGANAIDLKAYTGLITSTKLFEEKEKLHAIIMDSNPKLQNASICSSSAQHRLTLFCPTSIDSLLPSQSFTETNLSSRPIYSSSARPICFKA